MEVKKDLKSIIKSQEKVNSFMEELGGRWPKEKRFLQVIEETWELAWEILEGDKEKIEEELGDLIFTYMAYMEEFRELSFWEKRKILEETKKIKEIDEKEILLRVVNLLNLENKIFRKNEKRRNKNREIELNSEYSVEENRFKILFLLKELKNKINKNFSFEDFVDKNIEKIRGRDL